MQPTNSSLPASLFEVKSLSGAIAARKRPAGLRAGALGVFFAADFAFFTFAVFAGSFAADPAFLAAGFFVALSFGFFFLAIMDLGLDLEDR